MPVRDAEFAQKLVNQHQLTVIDNQYIGLVGHWTIIAAWGDVPVIGRQLGGKQGQRHKMRFRVTVK